MTISLVLSLNLFLITIAKQFFLKTNRQIVRQSQSYNLNLEKGID